MKKFLIIYSVTIIFLSIISFASYYFYKDSAYDHLLIINESSDPISVKEVFVNKKIVGNKHVDVLPLNGRSYAFATFYGRIHLDSGDLLELIYTRSNGYDGTMACRVVEDDLCMYTVRYGKNNKVFCSCDSMTDSFDL